MASISGWEGGRFLPEGPLKFSSVAQSCPTLSDPVDCSTPGLSITNSQSLLKLMSFELVMSSNHLILCHPLLFLLQSSLPVSKWHITWLAWAPCSRVFILRLVHLSCCGSGLLEKRFLLTEVEAASLLKCDLLSVTSGILDKVVTESVRFK